MLYFDVLCFESFPLVSSCEDQSAPEMLHFAKSCIVKGGYICLAIFFRIEPKNNLAEFTWTLNSLPRYPPPPLLLPLTSER